ncbi:glycosyltransferase [Nocardia sp. 348MFTsu5.1]|uniref:glycosyltransferase n=1 Tax=Nocardia sp. 348MFTsu5.1 TaxID=1172185 RepID=UPI00049101A9|nr:glycosyltransferase [Nocardia sp. 348MFTsu5.1]
MKILVYPHDLAIGGSQINAIELAAAVSRLGHEVIVFGVPGPLVGRIRDLGLEFIASPQPRRRPSFAVLRALTHVIREREIEVIHGYEWPPALESYLVAARMGARVSSVSTVMSMAVAPFLPRTAPLLVGTEQIACVERSAGRHLIGVLEPPVDLDQNRLVDGQQTDDFRSRWQLDNDATVIVTVTRLAHELKLEGLLTAISTIGELVSKGRPVQLVIVGAGPAGEEVARHASVINQQHGDRTVVLTGELDDPRPAYAVADIVLGMGGSVLRAMAFGKPVVVQGENGFWKALNEDTVGQFRWTGWYGVGTGPSDGPRALLEALTPLVDSETLRGSRGDYARQIVEDYSLDIAAVAQLGAYVTATRNFPGRRRAFLEGVRVSVLYATFAVRERWNRLRGRRVSDDFNSKPVAAKGVSRPEMSRS